MPLKGRLFSVASSVFDKPRPVGIRVEPSETVIILALRPERIADNCAPHVSV